MVKLTQDQIKVVNKIWMDVHETLNEALNNGLINSEAYRKVIGTLNHKINTI